MRNESGTKNEFVRFASPNEQRSTSREDGGFYHSVIVGAIYEFDFSFDAKSRASFFHPLRWCIENHAHLCVVISGASTEKPFYERVPSIRLEDHITILNNDAVSSEMARIEGIMAAGLDKPFPPGIPPWRIVVLPLASGCFVAFSFSHTIADGPAALSFHRTFREGCATMASSSGPASSVIPTPARMLPPPFDTPQRLPISWSYLMRPLLALILPAFLSKILGLRLAASTVDEGTWLGVPVFFDPEAPCSNIKLQEIETPVLSRALQVARRHDAKLTAVFGAICARALSKAIPDTNVTNFVSSYTMNMRSALGVSEDNMGDFASGYYSAHIRDESPGPLSSQAWEAASATTKGLAEAAVSRWDQPNGLLRYLPSVRNWTFAKLGKPRDASFEVSNLGSIQSPSQESSVKLTKMVFAQPGHVLGQPINFNMVSVKGGSLVYTVTWQVGAFGVPINEEEKMIGAICSSIREDLESLA